MRFEATGHYTFAEVVDALEAALSETHPVRPVNLILDIRSSDETRSADELRRLASLLASTPGFGGACAVLVPAGDDLHFGLARMLGAYSEPLGVRVAAFESDAEARAFIAPEGVERSGAN